MARSESERTVSSLRIGMSMESVVMLLGSPDKTLPKDYLIRETTKPMCGGASRKVNETCYVYENVGFLRIWIFFDHNEKVEYITVIDTM